MKKRASRTQTLLLYGLLVVALAVGAYFYFFTGLNTSSQGTDPSIERLKNELSSVQDTDTQILINLDLLLNDPRFHALKQFGDLPVEAGKEGRSNPFLAP